jgi:hypothetical protein
MSEARSYVKRLRVWYHYTTIAGSGAIVSSQGAAEQLSLQL